METRPSASSIAPLAAEARSALPATTAHRLGKDARILNIELWWPATGTRQNFANVGKNQFLEVHEFAKEFTRLERRPFVWAESRPLSLPERLRAPVPSATEAAMKASNTITTLDAAFLLSSFLPLHAQQRYAASASFSASIPPITACAFPVMRFAALWKHDHDLRRPDAKSLASLSRGASLTSTLVVSHDASHAENIRVRRYESADREPSKVRRLEASTKPFAVRFTLSRSVKPFPISPHRPAKAPRSLPRFRGR